MRQRKNESGQALLLAICVISLGVAITLYAFLGSTSTSRENARLSASSIDVSQREDVLMRSILHKTAEGLQAGQTWDTILNNALTEVRATSYINSADLTVLFPNQTITAANIADNTSASAASTTLPRPVGLSNAIPGLVPSAGTSGLSSSTTYTTTPPVPPLLQYPGGTVQEAADRALGLDPVTTPQNLFFKAIYSSANTATPTSLSTSSRWGQLTFPNIRFGLQQPGNQYFIARRAWWMIPVVLSSSGGYTGDSKYGLEQGFTSHTANYILSVYDFPSQLPIRVSGGVNAVIGQEATGETWGNTGTGSAGVTINGSIYGDSVQLSGSTFTGNVSARTGVSVQQATTVGSETFSDNTYADLGTRETKDTARGIGAPPVSASGDGGKVLLASLANSDNFLMNVATPGPWDLYSRPYYRCPVRIVITSPATGQITITIYAQTALTVGNPDAIMGSSELTAGVLSAGWTAQPFPPTTYPATTATGIDSKGALVLTTTTTGNTSNDMNLLQIDLSKLPSLVGLSQAQMFAVYVGYQPSQPLGCDSIDTSLAIGLTGCSNLSGFTNGLSIVTKQRLYFLGDFNQTPLASPLDSDPADKYPATSVYAKEVRYGAGSTVPTLNFQGRMDLDKYSSSSATQINSLAATSGSNTQIAFTQRQFNLFQIKNPKMVPPITRMNLLFMIEKEYTH
jgi:hypothetical protein